MKENYLGITLEQFEELMKKMKGLPMDHYETCEVDEDDSC